MSLQPGQRLGHYQIVSKIGQGGMGAVYQATDTRLSRSVAIKVLPAEVTSDPERRARFHQEARLAAAFSHPNIATVHDVGEEDGITFIVMEVVRGDSLRKLVRAERLTIDRVLTIAEGIAAGLARAHRDGVVHRDLKPDNVVLTDEGQPKILDFGLGKLLQETMTPGVAATDEAPTATHVAAFEPSPDASPYVTRAGQVIGTLAYMSPEQLQGGAIDARTDLFSFGVLLYEMLSGRRPFAGKSNLDTATSILRDEPTPLHEIRKDVPEDLHAILQRSLAKDPDARYASGQELHEALRALRTKRAAAPAGVGSILRRPGFLAVSGLVVVVAVAVGVWFSVRTSRVNWARNTALPESERLAEAGDRDAAWRLLREAAEVIPSDPRLQEYVTNVAVPFSFESEPTGADVFVKGYSHPERPWIPLGRTPLSDVSIALPARLRIEKSGYLPFEGAAGIELDRRFVLHRENDVPASMVHVRAGETRFGAVTSIEIEEFWIDKYEVTNRQFKEFVDDGGYRNPEYWREPIRQDGRELTIEQAASLFVDSTGRPGPAGWELGSYPENAGEEPVGGISWYEAAAFATWAGKSLPTVFHWHRAAQQSIFSEILLASNFDGEAPAPVGRYPGLGPVGTYDMAGNVKEWCLNRAGDLRYILGGAWPDPKYRYRDPEASDPLDRSATNGVRCIRTDGPLPAASTVSVDKPVYDFKQLEPVADDIFQVIRGLYGYDRSALDARVESVDDVPEHWRKEVVSFRAAYGDERVPVHLYLPKNTPPPYQAIIYFPGSDALFLSDSRNLRFGFARFIPRSGRALVYPIYKGTYERQIERTGPNDTRDLMIQASKDLQRTIDYLETREDIDTDKLAYYGLSWGAAWGPVFTAIEKRFSASVLLAGGMSRYGPEYPPEAIPPNFAPRSTVPVLMINGRNDFGSPLQTEIQPMFALQGAPDEHKRLVVLDGGHVPESANEFIREVLDWLDRYLGPVEQNK
jgi:predicted Ser/Thr protein kinase